MRTRKVAFRFLRFGIATTAALGFLAACSTAPRETIYSGPVETEAEGIQLVENQQVETRVRQDFDAAVRSLHAGEYARAIELLEKVIKGSQNNSAPYINLAKVYVEMGSYDRAEESLREALRINPEHPVSLHDMALLYRKTGRYMEAREKYEMLISKYPEFMPARKNLGILCELYLDDPECALEQYRKYHNDNPEEEEIKIWMLGLERRLGL